MVSRGPAERVLALISRVTSTGAFIAEVDGLRFMAIMGVLLFHAHGGFFEPHPSLAPWVPGGDLVGYVIQTGSFGVQLFFVISGFVLALPFAEHHLAGGRPIALKAYFVRRVTRLEPPYIVSLLLVALAVGWVSADMGAKLRSLVPHFFAHMFYVHNLVYGDINAPGFVAINHVTWSLEIEIQFYVLAPFLARLFSLKNKPLRRALIVALIAASWLVSVYLTKGLWRLTIAQHLHYFLIGFLLVDVFVADWNGRPVKSYAWDVPGVIAWVALPFALGIDYRWKSLVLVVIFVAYLGAFRGRLLARFFGNRWLAAVGGMCYTIYLYHAHMIYHVNRWLESHVYGPVDKADTVRALLQLGLMAFTVVAFCAVPFVLLEKPFMRRDWHKALVRRLRGDGTAS